MQRGANGAMTGFSYPKMMADVIAMMRKGETDAARDLFDIYLPLIRYEGQPGLGLVIRKHILAQRGAIAHGTVRKPGPSLSESAFSEIEALIQRQTDRLAQL